MSYDRVPDDILLGAHVSTAGGLPKAIERAIEIGATAIQVFTKQANRWAERICEEEEVKAWRSALAASPVRVTVSHDSYLINCASPDAALRDRSIESYVSEVQRCNALGLDFLVSHPGNWMEGGTEAGVERNAEAIARTLSRMPGDTVLCLETTAGGGTALGRSFEELAAIIEAVPEPHRSRLGVCVDTCHVYSASYDLVDDYDGVWSRFDDALGMDRLRVLHLNDSKHPLGSRKDRHELIGEGTLGPEPFRRIMNDPRLAAVPKILETPKGDDHTAADRAMIGRLLSYVEREKP
jgi:deoxyribonuclease IV